MGSNFCGVNLRYFLQSVYFCQKNCGIFCKIVSDAQMIAQKFAFCLTTHIIPQIFSGKKTYILALLFARHKKYRKYLRYILQNAKNTAKISAKINKKDLCQSQIFAIFFADC